MDEENWLGLTVRTRDATVLGVVAGEFAAGPLTGRLRVEREYAAGIAVYAIPRRAVVRRQRDSLLLDVTLTVARGRWLMHVRQSGP